LGAEITIIDADPQLAREAEHFGFKVYYGDGTRLDILHAAGAQDAKVILVCVDEASAATLMVEQCKHAFPQARVIARSFDRGHAAELVKAGADVQVRETFESAMVMGREALLALGTEPMAVDAIVADMRRRDAERFQMELDGGGLVAGRPMILGNLRGRPGR
ncbi:NAD-binding protein, partial [Hydrogenophaga borbori]|uniref:NAD-binding protein n=2 Tax=Hydrogenophaga TaxID=47420 RepID=UPI00301E11CB